MKGNRGNKKNRKHTLRKWEEQPVEDQPFFASVDSKSISTNYIHAAGDSGDESDQDHILDEFKDLENRTIGKIRDSSAFSTINFGTTIKTPTVEPEPFENIESVISAQEHAEIQKTVRTVLQDLTDASRELQSEFNSSVADQARRQILSQLVTDASFYLYLIASGFASPHHPVIQHMNYFKQILEGEASENEQLSEEEQQYEIEEEETIKEHVPEQMRKVEDGAPRFVTKSILSGKGPRLSKPKWRNNSKTAARKKYARAAHIQRMLHPQKELSKDGIYRGESSGISQKKIRSVSLHPAH